MPENGEISGIIRKKVRKFSFFKKNNRRNKKSQITTDRIRGFRSGTIYEGTGSHLMKYIITNQGLTPFTPIHSDPIHSRLGCFKQTVQIVSDSHTFGVLMAEHFLTNCQSASVQRLCFFMFALFLIQSRQIG